MRGEEARVSFSEEGIVLVWVKRDILVDSFSTFELSGKRYLSVGSLMFEVKGVSEQLLELRVRIPTYMMNEMVMKLIPDETPLRLDASLLHGNWKMSEDDKYMYGNDKHDEPMQRRVFRFGEDQHYTEWSDSTLVSGKWRLNGLTLEIEPDKGPKERFYIRTAGKKIGLIQEGKTVKGVELKGYGKSPEELKLSLEGKKKKDEPATEEEGVNDVIIEDVAPVAVEVGPGPELDEPAKTMNEMLCDTFKATAFHSYADNKSLPAEKSFSIVFLSNGKYTMQYGSLKESGTWSYSSGKYVLIMNRNGKETMVPMNVMSYHKGKSGRYSGIQNLTLSLVLPGEQQIKTVHLMNE